MPAFSPPVFEGRSEVSLFAAKSSGRNETPALWQNPLQSGSTPFSRESLRSVKRESIGSMKRPGGSGAD